MQEMCLHQEHDVAHGFFQPVGMGAGGNRTPQFAPAYEQGAVLGIDLREEDLVFAAPTE